jgi:acyl carrier protein
MKTAEFLDELCEVLGRDPGSLSPEDTPKTVKEWDSMGHLTIIATIDEVLEVSVEDEEMRNFRSIAEMLERLRSRNALED